MNATTARRAVVADLLAGKATPEAAALLSFAVRVERPAELVLAASSLVELADAERRRVESHATVEMEPVAARGVVRDRIRGFSERVLQELSATHDVDEVEDELFAIARLVDANRALRQTLGDANLPLAGRFAVVDDLFGPSCRPATVRLARTCCVLGDCGTSSAPSSGWSSWLPRSAAVGLPRCAPPSRSDRPRKGASPPRSAGSRSATSRCAR